jgi:sortase A
MKKHGALRHLASILTVAGVVVLLDVAITLLWQEPVTAAYTAIQQHELGGQLHRLDGEPPSLVERRVLAALGHERRLRIAYLARELRLRAPEGSAVGRILIPAVNASYVVVKGTAAGDLVKGPGVYSQTPFPGEQGTVGIAGHRTTYLHPFRHIDKLRRGDQIVLERPYARIVYRVLREQTVLPTDLSVIDPVGYDQLVLSACTPPFSASHRLIVYARRVREYAEGAARV